MPAALPVQLRERVVAARLNGEGSLNQIADRFMIHASTVKRWVKQHEELGDLRPSTASRGPKPLITDKHLVVLEELLAANADATLPHLA